MLEVNSEWYGKTVYFRVAGSGGTGTAITIPAYTELETDENGNYIEGASGTKYKKAITFLGWARYHVRLPRRLLRCLWRRPR